MFIPEPAANRRPAPIATVCGIAGLIGAAIFMASQIILHLMRTDIDWTGQYVSHFAHGPLGWMFTLGALAHSVGNFALTLGLRSSLEPGRLRACAVALLGLAAAGIGLAAFFPIDQIGSSLSLVGLAHGVVVSASFPLELAALFLFSAAFARHPQWRRRSGLSFSLASFAAIALTGFLLAILLKQMPAVGERVALATIMVWELWAAVHLVRPDLVRQPRQC